MRPNQCVWMTGDGFGESCSIDLYHPSWQGDNGGLLDTVYDVVCDKDFVTIEIPEWIRVTYTGVNVVYFTNSKWTDPFYIPLNFGGTES